MTQYRDMEEWYGQEVELRVDFSPSGAHVRDNFGFFTTFRPATWIRFVERPYQLMHLMGSEVHKEQLIENTLRQFAYKYIGLN
jgi:hypothetical protein